MEEPSSRLTLFDVSLLHGCIAITAYSIIIVIIGRGVIERKPGPGPMISTWGLPCPPPKKRKKIRGLAATKPVLAHQQYCSKKQRALRLSGQPSLNKDDRGPELPDQGLAETMVITCQTNFQNSAVLQTITKMFPELLATFGE